MFANMLVIFSSWLFIQEQTILFLQLENGTDQANLKKWCARLSRRLVLQHALNLMRDVSRLHRVMKLQGTYCEYVAWALGLIYMWVVYFPNLFKKQTGIGNKIATSEVRLETRT